MTPTYKDIVLAAQAADASRTCEATFTCEYRAGVFVALACAAEGVDAVASNDRVLYTFWGRDDAPNTDNRVWVVAMAVPRSSLS